MRPRAWIIYWVIAAALIVPRTTVAQPALPTAGARVRVTAPDLEITELTGTLVRVTANSVTIDTAERESPVTIPIDRLSRLEVSTGKHRGAGAARGAKFGALFGALAGIGLSVSEYGCDEYCALGFLLYGVGGAGAGLILGGIVGAAFPLDRWEDVSLARQPSGFGKFGASRQVRVGLAIAF